MNKPQGNKFPTKSIPRSIILSAILLFWLISSLIIGIAGVIQGNAAVERENIDRIPLRDSFSDNYNNKPRSAGAPGAAMDAYKEMGTVKSPPSGRGEIPNMGIFYFLHISDTQFMWSSDLQKEWYLEFMTEVYGTIQPKMIINTGDLIDSDYHGFFRVHYGQREWEWKTYRDYNILANMSDNTLYDIAGNHDAYDDPGLTFYLNYSMQKKIQYDFTINLSMNGNIKKYHFIGINTADETGIKYPFCLFGRLSDKELDWYEQTLKRNPDADMTIVFGHHPAYDIIIGQNRFFKLNKQYGVDAYLYGHQHKVDYEYVDNRIPSFEITPLSTWESAYRIFVIDNDRIATQVCAKDKWPVGVISAPISTEGVYKEIDDDLISDVNQIHVMAWDPKGITRVSIRIKNDDEPKNPEGWSDWYILSHETGPLYSLTTPDELKTILLNGDKHIIEAKLEGNSGISYISIIYSGERVFHKGYYIYQPLIIATGLFILIGLPLTKGYLRKRARISPKTESEQVDKSLLKILLIKILVILFMPLTFGSVYSGETDVVFGLFYLRPSGLVFYGVNILFTLTLLLFGIIFFACCLGKKWSPFLVFPILPVDMLIIGTHLYVYFTNLGAGTLIAPGYYLLLLLDFAAIARVIALRKEL